MQRRDHSREAGTDSDRGETSMTNLMVLVRQQVLAEGPEYLHGNVRRIDEYVDAQINAMTNVELLERISAALEYRIRFLV
jgi:hypothetical protein